MQKWARPGQARKAIVCTGAELRKLKVLTGTFCSLVVVLWGQVCGRMWKTLWSVPVGFFSLVQRPEV